MSRTVQTSMGPLTLSPLTQPEIKAMFSIIADRQHGFGGLRRFIQIAQWSISKAHPELTVEKLEAGLTPVDFMELWAALLSISKIEPGTITLGEA